MAENKLFRGRRVLGALSALALASAGLVSIGSVASADADPTINVANIDESKARQITIHKHQHQSDTDITADPTGEGHTIPSPGVPGVVFTAYPLEGFDFSDNADWAGLQTLTPSCTAPVGYALGAGVASSVTDAQGLATITGLGLGAYVVCETTSPVEVVDQATPFFVTVPFPHENVWLYNVHVYPKNGLTTAPEKTITVQEGLGLGSVVKFPVTTTVPQIASDASFTNFIVKDTLDDRLGNLAVSGVTLDGSVVAPDNYVVATNGQELTVTFNAGFLTALKAKAGKDLVVTFEGTVDSVADGGAIKNTATVYINDPDSGMDSNTVTTNWGDVKVLKTDEAEKPLDGAKFRVYPAAEPYAANCVAVKATGTAPIDVDGETEFVSTGGVVTIGGLFVSDSVNPSINATKRCYVLEETQAPAGYITPTGPEALTALTVVAGETAVSAGYDATVTNKQQEGPNLPLTGAQGQLLMLIGGSAVLLVGTGLMVANRRRSSSEN